MFTKVLIANRGEVALRIIRACKELGIRTVAVYSEVDAPSLPVQLADEAICIGRAPSRESYLNIPSIMSAAEITDVDAIHPGYGFLAENAHFAEVCQSCHITFIGPSPENLRLMGDKIRAKQLMKKAGVPVIPGSEGVVATEQEARALANKLGYPVIIKAVQGGGGRGMRICHNDVSLVSGFLSAKVEAEKAFGNGDLYIEKHLERPRHIEFQIVADRHGHIIHLGERDCSIQRNHQKLLEEAPSPALDEKLRKRIGEMAIRGAKAAGYVNVGTMEFLVERGQWYFIEMNTRIQVEHPVTEVVTGVDLVKEQIRVAAGQKLTIRRQENVRVQGTAMECRINAEDPEQDFLPSPGRITSYQVPGGANVRVDSHAYAGYEVPSHYDSMIGKLITYGRTRDETIRTMQRALDEYIVEPIKTTIPLHRRIIRNPRFLRGDVSTSFLRELNGRAD